jgi:heme oxygenase
MTRKLVGTRRGSSAAFSTRNDQPEIGLHTMRGAAPATAALPGVLHRALRAATRSDHVAVDGLILRLNLSVREDYGVFLRVHHDALQRLEGDWRQDDASDFLALLRCAQDDLKALKMSATTLHSMSRTPLPKAQRLGVAYVIRGSRLGAGVLRNRVPSRLPSSYLDFSPTLPWPRFLQQLDPPTADVDRASTYEVIRGARFAFELFAGLLTHALG